MRREARIRTWRSENFFSSSRVRLEGVSGSFGADEREKSVPLLNFVEALEERDGNEDDDGFLAVADFEL